MEFEKIESGETIVLKVAGRIDTTTADEFSSVIKASFDKDKDFVLDFKDVEYISSSGLRVLLQLRKQVTHDEQVLIQNTNAVVYDVFELTGLAEAFNIKKEYEEEKPDIKAIFFDVDGTLLSHRIGRIPHSTIEALHEVQQKGVKLVIATGRDMSELNKLPIHDIEFDGYLTLNGNICLDKDKNMFAGHAIDEEELEVLVSIFSAGKIPFVMIGEKTHYINYVDDVVIQTQLETHGTVPDIGEYNGEKIYQCLAFVDRDMRQRLTDMLDRCTITSWNDTGIDIIAKTGGKDVGIQSFLDKEGISRSQSMAFGDGENDMAMLRYVGIGVAMGNANDYIRRNADYVTTSVDEDGIANALKHFGMIN